MASSMLGIEGFLKRALMGLIRADPPGVIVTDSITGIYKH